MEIVIANACKLFLVHRMVCDESDDCFAIFSTIVCVDFDERGVQILAVKRQFLRDLRTITCVNFPAFQKF